MPSQGDELVARKLEHAANRNTMLSAPGAPMLQPQPVSQVHAPPAPAPVRSGTQRRQHKGEPRKLSRDAKEFIPMYGQQSASFTKASDTGMIHDRVGYLRPDVEEAVHQRVWESIEHERMVETHRQNMIQVNREMLRRDRDNMVKKRLELEARSGLVRDPALLSQYGIDLNEVQKSKVPRPPNHNANHLYRAATGASKLAEQYLRRHDELEKVRARHSTEKALEKSLNTPFHKAHPSGSTYPPVKRSGTCVTQPAAEEDAMKGPTEEDLKLLSELETTFAERQKACREERFAGPRKKENFDLSLNYKALSAAVFERPLH